MIVRENIIYTPRFKHDVSTKVDVNAASKLYPIQVQFMSAALLINMVSIPINIATNLHASWSCFSSFF